MGYIIRLLTKRSNLKLQTTFLTSADARIIPDSTTPMKGDLALEL